MGQWPAGNGARAAARQWKASWVAAMSGSGERGEGDSAPGAGGKGRQSGRPPVEGVMGRSNVGFGGAVGEMPCHASSDHDPVRRFFAVLPRPLRFLGVGGLGLITDLAVFTLIIAHTPHPLLARLVSLAIATLVTWRLNRALTFDRSGRHSADEAMRYAAVAASAQAV